MSLHSRREFLQLAAGAAVASSALAAPAQSYDGEIVDTHQHLWNLKEFKLPWVDGLTGKAKDTLGHDYLPRDYDEAIKSLGIRRAVYMEVDVAEKQQPQEVEFITKLCAAGKTPTVAAVVSGRPASDGFKDDLDRLKGNKHIKGLRQVLHTSATPPKFCLEEKFVKGVQLLGERGLRFDLCFKNDQLEYGAELIDRCPQTKFILDHCGNPHLGSRDLEGWKKGLAKMAATKNRNVMCKVSGIYGNVTIADWPADKLAPVIRTVIDQFGWDRVMFASDWPVVNLGASLKQWVETVRHIVRGDRPEDQEKLFRGNAVKFYGLG
jgi:predicted TIM-barrel fold metal-dependent hydrolase